MDSDLQKLINEMVEGYFNSSRLVENVDWDEYIRTPPGKDADPYREGAYNTVAKRTIRAKTFQFSDYLASKYPEADTIDVRYMIDSKEGDYMLLSDIIIRPKQQGKGHGTKIIQLVKQYAEKNNLPLRLAISEDEVGKENADRLRKYYPRLGFKRIRKDWYEYNGKSLTENTEFRIYNKTLCPDLWDANQHLDPEVRQHLLQMAYDFYEKTDFKAPILDVYFMGSSANYNWTPDSDVDVHVLIDLKQLQMPEGTAESATHAASSLWNVEHEVTVKGHTVEMNIQPLEDTKPHVTGIYSLVKDLWVRKPSHQNINVDKQSILKKYNAMKNYIDTAISTNSRQAMKDAKSYVDALRQYGLDTAGELGTENIVFKLLRARGVIKKLKNSITATYDKEMTVTEADNEIGKDWIGIVDSYGSVSGTPVKDANQTRHMDHFGVRAATHFGLWRYFRSENKVGWSSDSSPDDEKVSVDNFLYKHGIENPDHFYLNFEIINKDFGHDKKMTVAENNNEIGKDYLGTTFMGSVKAVTVKSAAHCTHQNYGMISGVNSQNWRYYRDRNQVLWNEQPIPEDVVKVDDFLAKRGITNPQHRNLYNRGAGFDTKRGVTGKVRGKVAEGDADALVIDTDGYCNEYSYTSDEAVGPFLIFLDEQKKVHWMFLVNSTADYFLDGKKLTTGGGGSNTTHLNMVNRIQPMFPQVMFTRKSGEMVVGRTWKVEGKVYFICWNSDFSLVTIPNVFHYLDLIFRGQCGITDPNRIFYQTDGGVSVPYEQFKLYGVSPDDDDDDDDDDTQEEPIPPPEPNVSVDIGKGTPPPSKGSGFKDIHTMSPADKKRELAKMGAVPKVPEIPDWQKKRMAGIDEDLINEVLSNLFDVTLKQVGAVHPTPCAPQLPNQQLDYSKMTMANIKSLRDKTGREWDYCRKHEDTAGCELASKKFAELHSELKRRLKYINAPIKESANEVGEEIAHSFETHYHGGDDYVEVFRNPTPREFKACQPSYEVGALLYGRDIYTFNRQKAYHKNVMTQMKMPDALSLLLYPDNTNSNRFDVLVTDSTQGTQWHHNPKTAGYIENHPFFRGKQIDHIMYWDEDVVGDWADPKNTSLQEDSVTEGYGAGIPEDDRLHIPDHRWQIRSKDAPKTPKMKTEEMTEIIDEVLDNLFSESNQGLWNWYKQQLPDWPDYVIKDFVYVQLKSKTDMEDKKYWISKIKEAIPNVKWKLEKLHLTMDSFNKDTRDGIEKRSGGKLNPDQVPKDTERHQTQAALLQSRGVSKEPIIVIKRADGYDLWEGFHRTIQNLNQFPQGYTCPAYVGHV